jgi:hypothetical protein
MKSKEDFLEELPLYLKELIKPPTPSNVLKLSTLWDSLQIERQIMILRALSSESIFWEKWLVIFRNALQSGNPYIRYLAAVFLGRKGDESDKLTIKSDPVELVRHALPVEFLENELQGQEEDGWLKDDCGLENGPAPKVFFDLPQNRRISVIRHGQIRFVGFLEILEYAATEGFCPEPELIDLVDEYFCKTDGKNEVEFAENNSVIILDRSKELDYLGINSDALQKAWELLSKMPREVSWRLLLYLPESIHPCSHENLFLQEEYYRDAVPATTLNNLDDQQVNWLFERRYIRLYNFRKSVALKLDDRFFSAVRFNFCPTDEEFANFLALESEQAITILDSLSNATEIPCYMHLEIYRTLKEIDDRLFGANLDGFHLRKNRINLDTREGREEEFLFELYEDASRAVRDKQKFINHFEKRRNAACEQITIAQKQRDDHLDLESNILSKILEETRILVAAEDRERLGAETMLKLSELVVDGNRWLSFMAFRKACSDFHIKNILLSYRYTEDLS